MRVVAPSNSYYHPVLRIAIDPPDAKRWSLDTNNSAFSLHCLVCANVKRTIAISALKAPVADLSAALAVLTKAGENGYNLKIGEVHREVTPQGETAWTEQFGSEWPYLGAFRRGDRYFLISLRGPRTTTEMDNDLRNDFLATARGVRKWNGE
jgi:hypothetical protein